jgi:bifunctional N6-L-threonylcarbamoyladenine synthase / protein kinase Bud32
LNAKKISEGAESHIYSIDLFGINGILKRRERKEYRLKEMDEAIRQQRTKNEARIIGFVSSLGVLTPKILLVDKYDIYMSNVKGKNLHIMIDLDGKTDIPNHVFQILGEYAALLHNNNVTHGDFTPANVMVDDKDIYLIDFGLSEMSSSMENKALDLLLMKRSISRSQFDIFLKSYKNSCKDGTIVINRLEEIEKRGRYNTRTLLTAKIKI